MNQNAEKINFSKHAIVNDYAQLLHENGFRLLIPEKAQTYFFFSKDDKIGYTQTEYGGMRFSTVHKPCKECGTGYGLQDYFDSVENPTVENALAALIIAPHWASHADIKSVRKYANLEDYISKNAWQKYTIIEPSI